MRPHINLPKNALGMISDRYQSSLVHITRIQPGIYKTLKKCAPLKIDMLTDSFTKGNMELDSNSCEQILENEFDLDLEAEKQKLKTFDRPPNGNVYKNFVKPENFNQILTILRILNRVLPVIYDDGDERSLDHIDQLERNISDTSTSYDFLKTKLNSDRLDNEILYKQLILVVKNILFLENFTVPALNLDFIDAENNTAVNARKRAKFERGTFETEQNNYEMIWAPGIGFCRDVEIDDKILVHRIEVLRTLLILVVHRKNLFSRPQNMSSYTSDSTTCNTKNDFSPEPTDFDQDFDFNLPMFSSLVNSIMATSLSLKLESTNAINLNLMKKYIRISLIVLNNMILNTVSQHSDHKQKQIDADKKAQASSKARKKQRHLSDQNNFNFTFAEFSSKIIFDSDFKFLADGFVNLLKIIDAPYDGDNDNNNLKKMRVKGFSDHVLTLLWNFLTLNKNFTSFLIKNDHYCDRILTALILQLYYKSSHKFTSSKIILMILLYLSTFRNFNIKLCRNIDKIKIVEEFKMIGSIANLREYKEIFKYKTSEERLNQATENSGVNDQNEKNAKRTNTKGSNDGLPDHAKLMKGNTNIITFHDFLVATLATVEDCGSLNYYWILLVAV